MSGSIAAGSNPLAISECHKIHISYPPYHYHMCLILSLIKSRGNLCPLCPGRSIKLAPGNAPLVDVVDLAPQVGSPMRIDVTRDWGEV